MKKLLLLELQEISAGFVVFSVYLFFFFFFKALEPIFHIAQLPNLSFYC